jgi:hypothetical protein
MTAALNTRNLRHGHLSLADGALAAGTSDANNTLVVPIDEGNLSFDEQTPGVVVKNRGALDHWSKGEEKEVTVSFTMKYTQYGSLDTHAIATDSGDAGVLLDGGAVTGYSVRDFLENRFSELASTSGRTDAFTCTLIFLVDNPMVAAANDAPETLTFTKFKCESLKFAEGAESDTIAVTGRALLTTPASTRV